MSQPIMPEDPAASPETAESTADSPAPTCTPEIDAPPPPPSLSPASSTSTLPQGEAVVPPAAPAEEGKQTEAQMETVQQPAVQVHSSASSNNNDPWWCYGVRAYDGGYYDVGSFFVFHEDEQEEQQPEGEGRTSDGSSSNKVDSQVIPAPKFSSHSMSSANGELAARAAVVATATPFGYRFVDGLKVTRAGDEEGGKLVLGAESEVAVQAYTELEKQVLGSQYIVYGEF